MDQEHQDERQPQRRRSGQRPRQSASSRGDGQRRRSGSQQAQGKRGQQPSRRRSSTAAQKGSGSRQGGSRPQRSGQARRRPDSTGAHRRPDSTGAHRRPDSTGSHRVTSRNAVAAEGRHNANRRRTEAPNRPYEQSRGPAVSPIKIVLAVLGVVVVGVGIWMLVGVLSRFDVTVNGKKVTLGPGSTVQTLLDQKVVEPKPKPGNLLAVDGSLLTEGGGDACSATIDGTKASINTELKANNVIEIGDGEDTTEEADVREEKIPFEKDEGNRDFEAYWFGSIHLLSDGEDGVETTKTGKQSGKTVSEVTKEPINAGYRIYTAKPDDKVIALTFDDGPWPDTTDDILDILEENGAKATFFTIGNQISQNKDAVKRANDMGCQVLTHSWDHAEGSGGGTSLANMSSSEQIEEINKGYDAIEEVLGKAPAHIIRAPGGNFYGDIINNVWDIVDAEIGWDVDTEDWSRPGADAIAKMILSAKSGQVILMHDGGGDRSQTVQALRETLPQLVEKGYKFVTIDELLSYGMPSSKSDIPSTAEDEEDTESSSSSTSSSSTSDTSAGTSNSDTGTSDSSTGTSSGTSTDGTSTSTYGSSDYDTDESAYDGSDSSTSGSGSSTSGGSSTSTSTDDEDYGGGTTSGSSGSKASSDDSYGN